ncbi:DUF6075 family protein [Paenibacillus sp. FSL R10-2791]|uniref:DUF6075 family protein n=1 Tax=Paenibacillus sp. FSL R10-2791 TaxID=2954695 RepID=UPI0030FAD33C
MSTNFKDIEHEQFYEGNLRMTNIPHDPYHKALFYTLGLSPETRQHITDLYDHQENYIRLEGLHAGWQTGSTLKITRLAFNLFNGFNGDSELNPDRPRNYSPYFLFDTNLMSYFFESIKLRYEEYTHSLDRSSLPFSLLDAKDMLGFYEQEL